jgi:hypothetical protein
VAGASFLSLTTINPPQGGSLRADDLDFYQ